MTDNIETMRGVIADALSNPAGTCANSCEEWKPPVNRVAAELRWRIAELEAQLQAAREQEPVNAQFNNVLSAAAGLRGCNSQHGGRRSPEPCIYRMRTTDLGCTGCVERDEDQRAEAGGSIQGEQE